MPEADGGRAGDVVVFLGPTLAQDEASKTLAARYLPPAEQGSFVRAVLAFAPRAVVLIDGVFARVPAVRHKEILWTLARGVPVFGAASMGALRAAELATFGMRGFGLIYRWYARTPFADDDEVAVAMGPVEIGGAAFGEALVNMRLTLRRAVRHGIVPAELRLLLEEEARAMHFLDRNYEALLARGRTTLVPRWHEVLDRFEDWLPANAVDQKRSDALGLLDLLARRPELLRPPASVPDFAITEAWVHDLEDAGLSAEDILGVKHGATR